MGILGKVVLETVGSVALKGNPLGDPRLREVPVYLPPQYFRKPLRPFPVLYYLPGFTGTARSASAEHPWKENPIERLDRLIASGKTPPMILVIPDCFTLYGGSQYMDSPAVGLYETHLIQELVPYLDSRYRTGQKGVLGKSSGGYGALRLAMRHPEVFAHAASHSGDMGFEASVLLEIPKCVDALSRWGGRVDRFLAEFKAARVKDAFPHSLVNMVAMSACYSPDPKSPWGFALPFDPWTGELDAPVWERWLGEDPVSMARSHAPALKKLKTLYLDCGAKDEYALHLGARRFSRTLKALGVPHRYEEHPGGHFDTAARLDVSFPLLGRAMKGG